MLANGFGLLAPHGTPRGRVFRVKYRDAAGVQVQETLGREAEGWTEQQAERELGKRLDAVERERFRKPDRLLFRDFAARFQDDYLPGRNLKRSTLVDYKLTIPLVERPRLKQPEINVLTEVEVARVLTAYRELEQEAEEGESAWWRLARRLFAVALGTALRRGEVPALRWQDVKLLEGLLTVRESLVAGRFTTPKSRSSRRTIELGPRTIAVLQERWQETSYQGDAELVFCHPQLGTPLDPSKLSRDYMRPALKRAKITKPFRVWHDLRHTGLTHEAAAGNPQAYVQLKAGHSQGSITERYIHAAQVLFPGAAEKGEDRLFGALAD